MIELKTHALENTLYFSRHGVIEVPRRLSFSVVKAPDWGDENHA
jgi:hypothetical protein